MSAYYNDKKILTNVLVNGGIAGVKEVDGELEINGCSNELINIKDVNKIIRVYGDGSTTYTNTLSIYNGNVDVEGISATINLSLLGGKVNATNLKPENIKKGVNILGVIGTYEG